MEPHITKKEIIFVDFFDTIVHRSVFPKYVLKIWASRIQTEFSISVGIDELYKVRRDAMRHVEARSGKGSCAVSYEDILKEVFVRLRNTENIAGTTADCFIKVSEKIDLMAEMSVQYLNQRMIGRLEAYINNGAKVILLTDTYLSKSIIVALLQHHKIDNLFFDVYASCDANACKRDGSLFKTVSAEHKLQTSQITIIGDDKAADCNMPKSMGISSIYIPNRRKHFAAKKFLQSSEKKQVHRRLRSIEKMSRKGPQPYGEYSILLYTFIHGLYQKLKENKVENVFFLSREGLFLKKLFELYQERHMTIEQRTIQTHYIKISRKSSMMFTLKPINEEDFAVLRLFPQMSGQQFLETLTLSESLIQKLSISLGGSFEQVYDNFFESATFSAIKKNAEFAHAYNHVRKTQRKAFAAYIKSFGVDIYKEGMHIVDVGWGGTMQENLHLFLEKKIEVQGYYLGLRNIYNITEMTKRYGILFSVYPAASSYDDVLQGNCQLYEQILSAGHGFAQGYDIDTPGYVIEETEAHEMAAFSEYIAPLQAYYEELFTHIDDTLADLAYSLEHLKEYSFRLALRVGILLSKRNCVFLSNISAGFNQNVGAGKVGIVYNREDLGLSSKEILRMALIYPESLFKYVVKLKQQTKRRNFIVSGLVSCYYPYVLLHRFFRHAFFNQLPQM